MARRPSPFLIGAACAPALLLAGLSALSLAGTLTALPADATIEAVRDRDAALPNADTIADAARTQARAARWFERGRYTTAAVSALQLLPPRRQKAMRPDLDGEVMVRGALAAAPASSNNWLRLAGYRLAAGDKAGASRAWQMSVLTGRYVPGLMTPRLIAAFRLFPTQDAALLDLLRDQVRVTTEAEGRDTARAATIGQGEPYVRAVLWHEPELRAKFERGLLDNLHEDAAREAVAIAAAAEARQQAARGVRP